MRRTGLLLAIVVGSVTALSSTPGPDGCSTVIASGAATADGAPLLWKNRDTDVLRQVHGK